MHNIIGGTGKQYSRYEEENMFLTYQLAWHFLHIISRPHLSQWKNYHEQ
jgi:hypothetical protein